MVYAGTTVAGKNTAGVVVESTAIGINRDGNGLLSNGSLELGWATVGNILEALNTNLTLGAVVLARTVATSVFIVTLFHNFVVLSVPESSILEATVATTIISITVNELLLRKRKELTGFKEVGTFHSTSG